MIPWIAFDLIRQTFVFVIFIFTTWCLWILVNYMQYKCKIFPLKLRWLTSIVDFFNCLFFSQRSTSRLLPHAVFDRYLSGFTSTQEEFRMSTCFFFFLNRFYLLLLAGSQGNNAGTPQEGDSENSSSWTPGKVGTSQRWRVNHGALDFSTRSEQGNG